MAAFVLPLVFAVLVAWQLTRILPTPRTWPGMIFWWLLVMASSTMALRFADRFAKRLMPLAVLMKLSLVFPDKAPNRFGVSLKSGTAHSLEELLERAERAGRHDDLTEAAETILALGAALNAHDPRTRGHGDRVRAYADMLGEEMGYTDEERNKLKWAAMLHDIGKLRVPSEIINSPGKLTDEEWTIMRNHPDWGMELATPLLPWLGEFAAAIGQHHERFDGNGYPNGIVGEDIGLPARITSVADTYDVMTSVRSYKEARPAS
ncbi:MAG: HD domain-containing protein, partial [Acidimicrobiia bacterium]|nr:HD domain-containing protein [Acidimicrobiia bacterium]